MGWHSDNEIEYLGLEPIIASFSLGSERLFQFKEIKNKKNQYNLIL